MKRYSLLTLLLLTLTLSASAAFQDPKYPNLEFTVLDAETKTVSVKGIDNTSSDPIIIPSIATDGVDNYAVTTIAEQGFYKFTRVPAFTLPEGLTTILAKAFVGCTSLSDTTTIPSSINYIENFAFADWVTPIFFKSPTPPTLSNYQGGGVTNPLAQHFRDELKQNSSIIIPCGTHENYLNADGWKSVSSRLEEICMVGVPLSFSDSQFNYARKAKYATEVTIIGLSNNALTDVVIPELAQYEGKSLTITAIANSAFSENTTIESISFNSTITEIRDSAFFKCTSLKHIRFKEGLTTIKSKAFVGCTSIQDTIIVPSTVSTIGDFAFAEFESTICFTSETPATLGQLVFRDNNEKKSSILIPCNLYDTYINAATWESIDKNRIEEVCIATTPDIFQDEQFTYLRTSKHPAQVKITGPSDNNPAILVVPETAQYNGKEYTILSVSNSAFSGNTTIESISFNSTITEIRDSAFFKCTSLKHIRFKEGLKNIKYKAFVGCTSIQDTIVIPSTVSTIGDFAFADWVTPIQFLSETPATLGQLVFRGLQDKQSSILIPCNLYDTYTATWENVVKSSIEEVCIATAPDVFQDELFTYLRTSKRPAQVKITGPSDNNPAILVVPENAQYNGKDYTIIAISNSSFSGNTTIESISFNSTITEIADSAFYKCIALENIRFMEGLTTIKSKAFVGCTSIQDTVIIPSTVSTIGDYAFAECECPIWILSETPATVETTSFRDDNKKAAPIILPCGTLETYKAATGWSSFSSRFVSACKPLKLMKGEALSKDTIVSSIAFSRTFDMDVWQTLYLPFEVDSVLVEEIYEDKPYYFDINDPYDHDNGGYFYLNKFDTIDENAAIITFSTATTLGGFTPYLIQFPQISSNGYFDGKNIIFKSKPGEYTLKKSDYTQPDATKQFQISGNSSVYNQSVSDIYIFRATLVTGEDGTPLKTVDGKDSVKYEFNRQASATLKPFEFGLLPCVVEPSSGISSAPKRMSLRIGRGSGNTGGGGITTSVTETNTTPAITYRTGIGEVSLSLNGRPCQLYSISGTLLYSSNGGTEEITIPLEKGIYILYSEGQSQKIVL